MEASLHQPGPAAPPFMPLQPMSPIHPAGLRPPLSANAAAGLPPSPVPPLRELNNIPPKSSPLPKKIHRKALSRLPDQQDNIKVAVRVRPMNDTELTHDSAEAVAVVGSDEVQVLSVGPRGATMEKSFRFHACLGPHASQSDVMAMCNVPALLDAVLAGYNVSILAYGQTGSGKTFTVSGSEDSRLSGAGTGDGVMAMSCHYLFSSIHQRPESQTTLSCSFLEIYNEQIYDLVNWTKEQLPVRWDAQKGFHVPELEVVECRSLEDMMRVICTGLQNRSVGSHELNMESSRSHSIFTVYSRHASGGTVHVGKVSFVDLAGSERLKDSQSKGEMAKETSNINRSLFTLGKVISALADARSASGVHVPYRDSKLTKLLMDSLGGNALALFMACCSPSARSVEETLSTLHYATRAKNIVNKPMQSTDQQDGAVQMMKRQIEQLKAENRLLREHTPDGHYMHSEAEEMMGRSLTFPGRAASPLPPLQQQQKANGLNGHRRSSSNDMLPHALTVVRINNSSHGSVEARDTIVAELQSKLQDALQKVEDVQHENEKLRSEVAALRRAQPACRPDDTLQFLQHSLAQLEANMSSSYKPNGGTAGAAADKGMQPGPSPKGSGAERQLGLTSPPNDNTSMSKLAASSPLSACGRPPSRHDRQPQDSGILDGEDAGQDRALGGVGEPPQPEAPRFDGAQVCDSAMEPPVVWQGETDSAHLMLEEMSSRHQAPGSSPSQRQPPATVPTPPGSRPDHGPGGGSGLIVADAGLMQALLFGDG